MNTNTQRRVGLIVLGLLAAGDLVTPFAAGGDALPRWVALTGSALGVASLACVPAAWRGRRTPTLGLFGTRLVSALLAVPAFFLDDAPRGAVGLAAATVALTVLGVVLVLAGTRRAVTA